MNPMDLTRAKAHIIQSLETITEESFEEERKWELAMQERGRQRYLRSVNALKEKESEGNTSYGLSLIKHALSDVEEGIRAYVEKAKAGGRGRKATAAKYLFDMDLAVVSFLTLRKMVDNLSREMPLQNFATTIANEIMFEAKLKALKEEDTPRWNMTKYYLQHSQGRKYKSTVLNYAIGKSLYVTFEPWPANERIQLGTRLVEIVCETTGLFAIRQDPAKNKKQGYYRVHATEKVMEWVTHHNAHAEIMNPDYYPTLIPPKPWTTAYNGGYWHQNPMLVTPIMKTQDKTYLKALDSLIYGGHIEEVRQAINALQATAWSINTPILEVAEAIWNAGGDRAGLPPQDAHHLPLCPICGADITETASALVRHECLENCDKEIFLQWKREAKEVRELNAMETGKRIGVAKTLKIASTMSQHEKFYFPYQLDFRGRIYTIPAYLTPQGTDLSKALLRFADARPLGNMQAVKWLAIHVSNTFGNDKVSLDDRHSWTLQHQEQILSCAADPLGDTWWMEADEPFCFLAACMEWAGYVNEGLSYPSSLPIAMDGTCNGLQIFSLILRDEVGGAAVNLVPMDMPQDIYGIVAKKVQARLEEDAANPAKDKDIHTSSGKMTFNPHKDAKILLQLPISRKMTKRQVMVLPYGGTMQSCIEYTRVWMKENAQWPDHSEFNRLSILLAQYIWDAIGSTVIKAREAMDYLQGMARAVSKLNRPIHWKTPCGLPVKQGYKKYDMEEIRTLVGDKMVKLRNPTNEVGYNKVKQANSISPNFVHSLDAAALMRTVSSCACSGIHSFAMIHDSYGTHAADAPLLAATLRETFVSMFGGEHDILAAFEKELLERNIDLKPEDLPARPAFGSLNVDKVRESLFFFA